MLVAECFTPVAPVQAWDSATHEAITRLAIQALPPSPLKQTMTANEAAVERHSVEPDTILKKEYGEREKHRHYINVEWFGADPWSALNPNFQAMRRRFSDRTMNRSGTLPWTIEQVSEQLKSAWSRHDCASVVRLSGYLAHYVGDASQPLHSTIHFDGYRRDQGVHARIELAVDHSLDTIEPAAERLTHIEDIGDVWAPTIAEIRDGYGLVDEVIRDDRAARDSGDYRGRDYQRAVMREDSAMFARQIGRASSVLASIWLYEWRRAGSPGACSAFREESAD